MLSLIVLTAMALLVVASAVVAAALVRARRAPAPMDGELSRAVVIVPCKGDEPGLRESLVRYASQDHTDYRLVLATATADDAAVPAIAEAARGRPHVSHVVSGVHEEYVQKLSNVLAALAHAGDVAVVAFGDSDIAPAPDWLRRLVAPLRDAGIGATTGYRWYASERPGLWDRVTSLWNGFVLLFLAIPALRFTWGGSYALRRDVLEVVDLPRLWRGVLTDDLTLTAELRRRGLGIAFVPACVSFSPARFDFGGMIAWATRQLFLTRLYGPRVYAATFALSAASVALLVVAPWLSAVQAVATGVAVIALGRATLPPGDPRSPRWAEAPLFALCLIPGAVGSALALVKRRIAWRGVVYEVLSPTRFAVHLEGDA